VLVLPPLLRGLNIPGDAWEAGLAAARGGADPGTLLWSNQAGRCEAVVVLAPDRPLDSCLALLQIAALGLTDALGALGPPEVPIAITPPDRVEIDEGLIGGLRIAAATTDPTAIPDWLVIGFDVAMIGEDDAPGERPWRTTLAEEGFVEFGAVELIESFSRYFLAWLDAWQEGGDAAIEGEWRARLTRAGRVSATRAAQGLTIGHDAHACLAGPTWLDP
jgi:biotin-(acetyl-CoA carboxylase) ligase